MKNHHFDLTSVKLSKQILEQFDAVVLATDHDDFDYDLISDCSRILVDCKGVFDPETSNVVRA